MLAKQPVYNEVRPPEIYNFASGGFLLFLLTQWRSDHPENLNQDAKRSATRTPSTGFTEFTDLGGLLRSKVQMLYAHARSCHVRRQGMRALTTCLTCLHVYDLAASLLFNGAPISTSCT